MYSKVEANETVIVLCMCVLLHVPLSQDTSNTYKHSLTENKRQCVFSKSTIQQEQNLLLVGSVRVCMVNCKQSIISRRGCGYCLHFRSDNYTKIVL